MTGLDYAAIGLLLFVALLAVGVAVLLATAGDLAALAAKRAIRCG